MLHIMVARSLRRDANYAPIILRQHEGTKRKRTRLQGTRKRQISLKWFLRNEMTPSSCIFPKQLDKALRSTER